MATTQGKFRRYEMLIDGEFASAGEMLEVVNPATEEVVSAFPNAPVEIAALAVEAPVKAQRPWAALPPIRRAAYLRELSALLRSNRDFLSRVITEEQGKVLALAQVEVDCAADTMDYMAEFARRIEGEILPSDRPGENILHFKAPLGVVAAILPWTFPLYHLVRKLSPALIAGNTVVLKPSSQAPNSALEFARLVSKSSLPNGIINLITGEGAVLGRALASHAEVGMVSLTGSAQTGMEILRAAADNLTKVNLELSGKAPAIVMDDADMDLAVKAIRTSRIFNSGQACNSVERVFVHHVVADEFIARIAEAMRKTIVGNPLLPETEMGPLIGKKHLEAVAAAVRRALRNGAELLCGGGESEFNCGYYYPPTVLANCHPQSAIMQQEILGPVLPIATFKTLDEAIQLANDCDYGLAASLFTRSLDTAMRAANELKCGEVYLNREAFESVNGYHTGWRRSGIGGADGRHGLEEYLQSRVVYMNYNLNKQ